MALKMEDWDGLSELEKDNVIKFLRHNCKIDSETPEGDLQAQPGSYPIKDGITSGGYPKKYGREYRIYIYDINNIPSFLNAELKERGTRNRIGGSDVIEAIMKKSGFTIGKN